MKVPGLNYVVGTYEFVWKDWEDLTTPCFNTKLRITAHNRYISRYVRGGGTNISWYVILSRWTISMVKGPNHHCYPAILFANSSILTFVAWMNHQYPSKSHDSYWVSALKVCNRTCFAGENCSCSSKSVYNNRLEWDSWDVFFNFMGHNIPGFCKVKFNPEA